jgi:predicted ATPase with chaperone activity
MAISSDRHADEHRCVLLVLVLVLVRNADRCGMVQHARQQCRRRPEQHHSPQY